MHGGFCSLEHLRPQANALAAGFAVHAYERPGHGRSPDQNGPYSYAQWVTDALTYLDASGIASAHIVGFSDGANIGLLLALGHPQRVRSLVAISGNLSPAGFTGTQSDIDPPDAFELHPDPFVDAYKALSPDGPEHAAVVLAKLRRLWVEQPQIESAQLGRVTAPTLIVSGERDTIHPDHSRLIAASIPGARLCIVPDASHDLIDEHPKFITFVISEFLRGHSRSNARLANSWPGSAG